MAANLSRASKQENVSTSLSSGITDVAATMDVNDATKFNYPCYLVIDRVDSAGTLKSTSLWEYVKVTNIAGSTLTITRGQGGSTQQSHSSGAVVEAVESAAMLEDWYAVVNPEHTAAGLHVMGTATVNYVETKQLAVTSIASIATMYITSNLNASGASIVGLSTTGGLNALFQIPGGLASVNNGAGLIPIPASYTGLYMQAFVQTPSSVASVGIMIQKNFADWGYVAILGGATFASSASIGTPALVAGDRLTLDIRSNASLATDLSLLVRGI